MKIKLFFLLLVSNFIFSQNASFQNVLTAIPVVPGSPSTEIFRFRPGSFTQLDFNAIAGQGFTFDNSRWFAFGRVPAGTQTFYGLRFQLPRKAITMGYNDLNALNPRIEWIGNLATGDLGNLEFRVGSSLGTIGVPGINTLVSTMTSNANTVFGTTNPFGNTTTSPKVGIVGTTNSNALQVISGANLTAISASGGSVGVNSSGSSIGVSASGGSVGVTASGSDVGVSASGSTGVQATGVIGVQARGEEIAVDAFAGNIAIQAVSKRLGARIQSFNGQGFEVESSDNDNLVNNGGRIVTFTGKVNTGLFLKTDAGSETDGVLSFASGGQDRNVAINGETFGQGNFEAAIFGRTPNNNGNQFAGYFDGDIATSAGIFFPSDEKLKANVKDENNILERLSLLRPVNYDYKKMSEINLSTGKQHGFISQELALVFPELTRDITKPVVDKDGKKTANFTYKSINYTGLISVLTAGINELNNEVKVLKEELAEIKNVLISQKIIGNSSLLSDSRAMLEQNIPNPFTDQTIIKYQLPAGTSSASLMVFDLNGRIIKEFPLTKSANEITIKASDVGKGLFIYSLVQNGQELITKKMIIK